MSPPPWSSWAPTLLTFFSAIGDAAAVGRLSPFSGCRRWCRLRAKPQYEPRVAYRKRAAPEYTHGVLLQSP